MTPGLVEARDRALVRLLELTDSGLEAHAADRVVTLHCLEGLAPRFFAERQLGPLLAQGLDRLAAIPAEFPPDLSWDVAMARLDARYFRALHGFEDPPLPSADVVATVARVTEESRLAGWLLGELAGALGVELEIPDPGGLDGGERVLWRTHQIMLWTCYLRDPLEAEGAATALDELARALPMRLLLGELDSAAESMFCLTTGGRTFAPEHVERLLAQQRDDGSFIEAEEDDARERAHCTAVCLIALAALAEREAS